MEISAYTLSSAKLITKAPRTSSNRVPFRCSDYLNNHYYVPIRTNKHFAKRVHIVAKVDAKRQRNFGAISASGADRGAADDTEKWLLEPIGDGDSRHIGFQVSMPGAFEIASNAITLGRLPEKADLVIPVATVSGAHARIEKKGGYLLVMDLGSTNGTFVGEKRLKPGVPVRISSGSSVTFGDTHLAMFRVSKLDKAESPTKSDKSEATLESGTFEAKSESSETSSISETTS